MAKQDEMTWALRALRLKSYVNQRLKQIEEDLDNAKEHPEWSRFGAFRSGEYKAFAEVRNRLLTEEESAEAERVRREMFG